jgi:succinate dehydrogenase / fumarate reductase cytochrome b subunit
MNVTQDRPVFLNLLRIKQPVAAVVSILHRLTGFIMVILLPGVIYLLQLSLRVTGVFISWMFAHHFLAGIRFLLLDFDVGISRDAARKTAWIVHVGAVLIAVIAAGLLL